MLGMYSKTLTKVMRGVLSLCTYLIATGQVPFLVDYLGY
jgi:hypothetical protein